MSRKECLEHKTSMPARNNISQIISSASIIFLFCLLQACSSSNIDAQASQLGMSASVLSGKPFQHKVYSIPVQPSVQPSVQSLVQSGQASASSKLRIVLIDGDGRPFLNRTTVARNPTPNHSTLLALVPELTSLADVSYLGRPCYLYLEDTACNPLYWTLARYSTEVLESLGVVLMQLLDRDEQALLVGYSGGGVLAVMLAEHLPSLVKGVVTYGAPLDTTSWTAFHAYTSLDGSIDPGNDPKRYSELCQLHLYGDRDNVVPTELIMSWRWPLDDLVMGLDSDHTCCWYDALAVAIKSQMNTCLDLSAS